MSQVQLESPDANHFLHHKLFQFYSECELKRWQKIFFFVICHIIVACKMKLKKQA